MKIIWIYVYILNENAISKRDVRIAYIVLVKNQHNSPSSPVTSPDSVDIFKNVVENSVQNRRTRSNVCAFHISNVHVRNINTNTLTMYIHHKIYNGIDQKKVNNLFNRLESTTRYKKTFNKFHVVYLNFKKNTSKKWE